MDALMKENFESFLQQKGMRLTKNRISVLEYIASERFEFTVSDICANFEYGEVAKSTIYEVIDLLINGNFIEKIPTIDKSAKFKLTENAYCEQ